MEAAATCWQTRCPHDGLSKDAKMVLKLLLLGGSLYGKLREALFFYSYVRTRCSYEGFEEDASYGV